MSEINVVKTNIDPKDVTKVMNEFDKKETAPKVVNPGLDMIPKTGIEDAIAAAHKKLDPKAPIVGEPVVKEAEKVEEKGSKSKEIEKLKEKHAEPKGPKSVTIDLTKVNISVKFVGKDWRPMDIKLANAALIRAFRVKIRDAYRKGTK